MPTLSPRISTFWRAFSSIRGATQKPSRSNTSRSTCQHGKAKRPSITPSFCPTSPPYTSSRPRSPLRNRSFARLSKSRRTRWVETIPSWWRRRTTSRSRSTAMDAPIKQSRSTARSWMRHGGSWVKRIPSSASASSIWQTFFVCRIDMEKPRPCCGRLSASRKGRSATSISRWRARITRLRCRCLRWERTRPRNLSRVSLTGYVAAPSDLATTTSCGRCSGARGFFAQRAGRKKRSPFFAAGSSTFDRGMVWQALMSLSPARG